MLADENDDPDGECNGRVDPSALQSNDNVSNYVDDWCNHHEWNETHRSFHLLDVSIDNGDELTTISLGHRFHA